MDATPRDLQHVLDEIRRDNAELPAAYAGLREGMVTPTAFAADIPLIEQWLETQPDVEIAIQRPSLER